MNIPRYVNDGNFLVEQQNGPTIFRLPFYDKGDSVSFEATQTFRVQQEFYTPVVVDTAKTFYQSSSRLSDVNFSGSTAISAYSVLETEPEAIGNGLVEYRRTYASVPVTRTEYGSIVYPYQILRTITNTEDQPFVATVSEIQIPMSCYTKYEYSRSTLTTSQAPQIQVVPSDGVNNCVIYYLGGWTNPLSGDVLAKGNEVQIYKGKIHVRIGVYVTFPTPTTGSP